MQISEAVWGEFLGTLVLITLGNGVVAGTLLNRSKAQNAGWISITAGWARLSAPCWSGFITNRTGPLPTTLSSSWLASVLPLRFVVLHGTCSAKCWAPSS